MKLVLNRWVYLLIASLVLIFLLVGIKILVTKNNHKLLHELSIAPEVYYNDIIVGDDNADLQLIMFHSYYSAEGRQFFKDAYDELFEEYIQTGKIKLVIKLIEPSEHPDMMHALQTEICLGQYGSWYEYHNILNYNPVAVHSDEFKGLIDEYISVNIDMAECILDDENFHDVIRNNNDYYALNTKGSPTFVIGNKLLQGYKSTDKLYWFIDNELKNR